MSERDQVRQALRAQVMMQIYGELMKKSSEVCFNHCVQRPTSAFTPKDFGCLGRCTDRYTEAFTVVADAFAKKAEDPSDDAFAMAGLSNEEDFS
eukprot:CAMPEP_0114603738 /NCGR_PEP_ID=MMETSP0168-20121206/185_1 /TAXON_ID=95228 ORGANISM="Vannella sp., Strain DIVA3 517/6/12" /NCGR_SAMPLE_ID=MMETSP0168 /ASSEMBLY_ACC=CAM_ASM_000044 /LENGTH=93 /DNA_ID=CAMNT_0001814549 /DNA_START=25 /DNA_END=306 /DNA_ORIENTATION=-